MDGYLVKPLDLEKGIEVMLSFVKQRAA
jgi:hypothetical protein